MIKESSSLYKMPYFNPSTQQLKFIGKVQRDFQEVMCICNEIDCVSGFGGYKYNFSYSANPTIEPVSYKLKGYDQQANLTYDDIGININTDVTTEILKKIDEVLLLAEDSIPVNIFEFLWNEFNNQKLTENIFQRENTFIYRDEVYNDEGYMDNVIPSFKMSSNIYTINIQYSLIKQT